MNFSLEIQITNYLVARVVLPVKTAMSSNEHLDIRLMKSLVWLPLSTGH